MVENEGPSRFAVDPNALGEAVTAMTGVGNLLVDVRLGMARVRREAGAWAGDGLLPIAVADLLNTVDEAARRCQDEVVALSAALGRGALDYGAVENGVTLRHSTASAGT